MYIITVRFSSLFLQSTRLWSASSLRAACCVRLTFAMRLQCYAFGTTAHECGMSGMRQSITLYTYVCTWLCAISSYYIVHCHASLSRQTDGYNNKKPHVQVNRSVEWVGGFRLLAMSGAVTEIGALHALMVTRADITPRGMLFGQSALCSGSHFDHRFVRPQCAHKNDITVRSIFLCMTVQHALLSVVAMYDEQKTRYSACACVCVCLFFCMVSISKGRSPYVIR